MSEPDPPSVKVISSIPLVRMYGDFLDVVRGAGYGWEIELVARKRFEDVDERVFLIEAAWVVYSSGMRNSVVDAKWQNLLEAFDGFKHGAGRVVATPRFYQLRALSVINHEGKAKAVTGICRRVADTGWSTFKTQIATEGPDFLELLPFVGPITKYHLARNIGFDVVKPDRHLFRMALAAGYGNPHAMCSVIARETGERLGMIDVVLWRYATLDPDYLKHVPRTGDRL